MSDELKMIHAGCGGVVINDADYVSGEDGEEYWWDYRCTRCQRTFRTVQEFSKKE